MSFEEFVATQLQALLRFARVLTGSRASAEDVVQEALMRAHMRWRRIGALDNPQAYVRRMLVNEYVSMQRRRWRLVSRAEVDPGLQVPDPATAHADRSALQAELRRLSPRQRAVLVLRYYLGLSDNEIAEELGCTVGTVRGYASRALAGLRVELRAATMAEEES